jgi:hypothetical protein
MDLAAFRKTFEAQDPPVGLTRQLRALWYVGKQYWDRAHALIQTQDDADSCRIHAHLHRLDGDLPNAAYWYSRAGLGMPDCDTQTEWEQIATALLARDSDDAGRRSG